MATDITGRDIVRPSELLSEFVGTFALIFIGAGSIVATQQTGVSDLLGVAVAHGFVLVVMISAIGHISGGHLNPAVTFGAWITQKISGLRLLAYWATQIVAATIAAYSLRWLIPASVWKPVHLGAAQLTKVHSSQGMIIEAILTFFLVWVVFATAIDEKGAFGKIAGIAIGATVMVDILMGGPFTGAAMNPARAFGPALASNTWTNFWVWIVGPLLGGALAALSYDRFILRNRED